MAAKAQWRRGKPEGKFFRLVRQSEQRAQPFSSESLVAFETPHRLSREQGLRARLRQFESAGIAEFETPLRQLHRFVPPSDQVLH